MASWFKEKSPYYMTSVVFLFGGDVRYNKLIVIWSIELCRGKTFMHLFSVHSHFIFFSILYYIFCVIYVTETKHG